MVKSNYRTAAEGKHVSATTRRRRRILQAGFLFMGNVVHKIIMRTRRMEEFDKDNGGFV